MSEPAPISMATAPAADPLLARFRVALAHLYEERLARVVLFGSRARGDFREDSDYDIAIFLKGAPDFWSEMRRVFDLRYTDLGEQGLLLDTKIFDEDSYSERSPIMHEIRKDGLDL